MLYRKKNPHGGAAYEAGVELDLSANTNPLGTPPAVLEAVFDKVKGAVSPGDIVVLAGKAPAGAGDGSNSRRRNGSLMPRR